MSETNDQRIYDRCIIRVGQLEADNAELRELVADAWGYINHTADATWTHKKRKEVRDSIADRMRELGVEVS